MVIPGDVALRPASPAAVTKPAGLLPPAPVVIPARREIDKLAAAIVAKPQSVIATGKALFYRQLELGVMPAYQLAGQSMACNMIDDIAQEGVSAFIEKRTPKWSADRSL